ncbi:HlyD family efflux transporter periplasmic adaptor subunit [Pirellulales bacterium]|nr:HlyD family efflux transporter periplasmic adaptor subunit [Pirellulales bacterium]
MNSLPTRRLIAAAIIAACFSGCGGNSDRAVFPMPTHPVTVLKLVQRDFLRESRLTGSVGLYREEQIGFEVRGRVLSVLDMGKEVLGPSFSESGKMVRQGEIIAQLDRRRYELHVSALEARLRSLNKQLDAQKIDVERVAKNDIKAAQRGVDSAVADLKLARQTLDRNRTLVKTNAISQQELDEIERGFDAATARKLQSDAVLDSARGGLAFKEATVESTAAQVDELTQDLERAQEDLNDCTLYAPFNGRITHVHTTQGAVVEQGTPLVTLSLMDPIQVKVAVSANEDRKIQTGDRVLVYPRDPIEPDGRPIEVQAMVYEKGAVADPSTRTFQINLMARNQRRLLHQAAPETKDLPVILEHLPVVRQYQGEGGPLFVQTDCVYEDSDKTYVLRLPGVSFHPQGQRSAAGKHVPEKVEVELGDDYLTVIKWNFRSLKSSGDLQEGDFLAVGATKEHETGLAIGRPQWLLRPGDIVPVNFLLESTPPGFYVPVDAIVTRGRDRAVFVANDGVARLQRVSVHETYGELRRINGDAIDVGAEVIIRGVHYVSDGQPVSIAGRETEAP